MKSFLTKRVKYVIYTLLVVLSLISFSYSKDDIKIALIFITFMVTLFGGIMIHFSKEDNQWGALLLSVLLPFHLSAGVLLSLVYFPNLALPIKIVTLLGSGVVLYAISLVNNILLVMRRREKTMPLYRVAVTWSQILLIVVAIPYFAGIYKIPTNTFVQNFLVGLSAFLFGIYLLWILSFDHDIKTVGVGERFLVGSVLFYAVFTLGTAISFIPTESFLRSLFISSVLMSSLGYLQGHYKNSLKKRILAEYITIPLIFLVLVFIFTP